MIQQWPSHILALVDRHGSIRGPEYENTIPSRSRFRVLNADGSMRDGPRLGGYPATSYPALDANGTAVFWHDRHLVAVDADLQLRVLYAQDDTVRAVSRVLLLEKGQLALAIGDELGSELLLFPDTGLGPLDTGPWPCGDSNIQGNPALPG